MIIGRKRSSPFASDWSETPPAPSAPSVATEPEPDSHHLQDKKFGSLFFSQGEAPIEHGMEVLMSVNGETCAVSSGILCRNYLLKTHDVEVKKLKCRKLSDNTVVSFVEKSYLSPRAFITSSKVDQRSQLQKSNLYTTSLFNNEAVIGMILSHPNLMSTRYIYTHEKGPDSPVTCHFWQHYGGRDLLAVHRQQPMSIHQWMKCLIEAFAGIEYMHSQGFMHLDLKPNNIVIDEHGNVRVIDFGMAKSIHAYSLTLSSSQGNAYYKAPEIWDKREPGYPSDVFSAGMCIVHAMEACGLMCPQPRECTRQTTPVQWGFTDKGKAMKVNIEGVIDVLKHMTDYNPACRPSMTDARWLLEDAWGPYLID